MNIFYGIVFIICGTWMITIQAKKLVIKKTIYFASIVDILLGTGCVVVGAILAVRNTADIPYAWLLYVASMVVAIIRLIRIVGRRITYQIKLKK
jgi:hypothetical protein